MINIDVVFAAGFLVCLFCGRDGMLVSICAAIAFYLAWATELHMIYCNLITAIVIFCTIPVLQNYKIKVYLFALGCLNLCSAIDYFTPYYTWFYLSYPWFTMALNTVLILEILKRDGRNESIVADICGFFADAKSRAKYSEIKAGL